MAKMTKAQAKKRLKEAVAKIDKVAWSDVARQLSSAQRNELYGLSNRILMIIKKLD